MILDFFCLQPIKIDEKIFEDIQSIKFKPSEKNWYEVDTSDNETNHYNHRTNNWYKELANSERHSIYAYKKHYNLHENHLIKLNNFINLEVNFKKSGSILFYDYNYKVYFLVLNLSFKTSKKFSNNDLLGIYEKIRNYLVIDPVNENFFISDWAKLIHDEALSIISIEHNTLKKNIEIIENTGYICSFFSEFNTEDDSYNDLFLKSNHSIDLIQEKKLEYSNLSIITSYKQNTSALCFLGWRHSTFFGFKSVLNNKLLPMLINIQNLYVQIDNYYKIYLSKLYEDVRYINDYVILSDILNSFDKLTISFQNFIFEKENFVSSLKPHQSEIYLKIEDYWGLKADYEKIEKTLQICQNSLNRKLEIRNNKIQQKQSDILFILAVIQIFSIIGIVGDSFDFFQLDIDKKYEESYYIIKKYLLLGLSALSVVLILFAYTEKVWFKFKRIITFFK